MAAIVLFGTLRIGKINRLPHWFHIVEHVFYYGGMTLLLAHALGRRLFWIALLAVPLVGALDEWHQLYVPGRNSSAIDWAVDACAALIGVCCYRLVRHDRGGKS